MELVIDVETTTYNNGNPFDERNSLVCIALYWSDGRCAVVRPEPDNLSKVQDAIEEATVLLGFNIKFDLHWLRRVGIKFNHRRIRDCQLVEFILSRQTKTYPSLDETAYERLGERKLDVVKEDYWDYGIQTDEIPWEVLSQYAAKDVELTYKVHQSQMKEIAEKKPFMRTLIAISCQDTLTLQECEWNGQRYNREASLAEAEELSAKAQDILAKLNLYHSVPSFNWNSTQHVSALLFGGTINEVYYEPIGLYKSGARVGQVKLGKKVRTYHLPKMFDFPKGYETPGGDYSVGEEVLLKLRGGKKDFLQGILELKKIEKDISTYLRGLPEKQDEGHYDKKMIYGQFNQCVARTGRLSSSKPNLQNLSDNACKHFISRY